MPNPPPITLAFDHTSTRGTLMPRWTTIPTTPSVPLTGHTDWVFAMCTVTLPGGQQLLASGSRDRTVRLWDPATGSGHGLLSLPGAVYALTGLADGSLAVGYDRHVAVVEPVVSAAGDAAVDMTS